MSGYNFRRDCEYSQAQPDFNHRSDAVPTRADKKGDPLSLVEEAIAGGVDIVQLRVGNPSEDDLGLFAVALRLREMTDGQALFIVTGDVELAEKSRADGILLAERSYKPSDARTFLRGAHPAIVDGTQSPDNAAGFVGAFARTVIGASRAERGGADYVQAGPIFDKDAHGQSEGLTLLRKVKDAVQIPVIAFGGIQTPEQVADAMSAGADGVAVTSAVTRAPDPRSATLAMRAAMDAAWRVLRSA